MDRFEALTTFRRVVETGGFAAAARALNASKATVSKRVSQLEAHLGVRLLNRTTRRLSLTEAGHAFHADSVRILEDLAAAEAGMGAAQAEPSGLLRINAPHSFGVRRLMPLLSRYMAACPKVRTELVLDDSAVDAVAEGFDLTLRVRRHLGDSQIVARRIGPIRHVVCASPAYLARAGHPQRPHDLSDHAMLVYGGAGRDLAEYRFHGGGEPTPVQVTPALRVNSSLAIREALLAGAGIAVTPRFAVDDALADGRLVELMPGQELGPYALHALLPAGRAAPAKTRRFLDMLTEARADVCD